MLFLSKTLYLLLSTGLTQEDRKSSRCDWDIKHKQKERKSRSSGTELHNFVEFLTCNPLNYKIDGKCSKISYFAFWQALVGCVLVKQYRPRSDCFWRLSLIRVFPVCYSEKHFVNSNSDIQHLVANWKRCVWNEKGQFLGYFHLWSQFTKHFIVQESCLMNK